MRKKEKLFVTLFTLGLLLSSGIILSNKENIESFLKNNSITKEAYENTRKKTISKNIKIKDKKLLGILNELSLEKLEIANSILKNPKILDVLQNKNLEKMQEVNNYDIAVENSQIVKELKNLEILSPELKDYIYQNFNGINYDLVVKNIKNKPEVLKLRERIVKLLPIDSAKETLINLQEEKLIEIGKLLSNSPKTIEFVEKRDIEKYNLSETTEIGKTLYKIGQLEPKLAIDISEEIPELDIRRVALYGDLYVRDEKSELEMKNEYLKENYIFESPYIKLNPYGRTPLTCGVAFNDIEDKTRIRVTILGKYGMPKVTYTENYKKNELLPIVGLYPKTKNEILLEKLDINGNSIQEKKLIIETENLDDRLPVVLVEKRVPGNLQPGVNMVSYNLKDQGLPFAFDSMGNIRYVLELGSEMRKVKIEKESNNQWKVKNDEDTFQLDIFGKILGRIGRDYVTPKDENKKVKYLVRNNNVLTVISYKDEIYPRAVFSEFGLDSKNIVFKASIYYDKNNLAENKVEDGERIELYEGDGE